MMKWIAVLLLLALAPVTASAATDALDEVNAARAKRSLPAFTRDDGLTKAALACADHRAARLISGHCDDFSFVPAGSSASAAGCAAWSPSMGWGSCCAYESWKYAGAAWSLGRDGRRYMHLFVRGGSGDGGSNYGHSRRRRR